ncbi:MAG: acyl-CoA dehydrogenase family protein [Anaerolineae bacterium]|nr:acyl-CoA dehydrogenase family protein [Chloroflexota bacterium]MBP6298178.1 acyl-CoA dehydrogenase family protein [Anaerolineae bacterium]
MFDFSITPHIQDLTNRMRRFIDDIVIPLEGHAHDDPVEGLPPQMVHDARIKAKSLGLWCPTMPPELGGLGLSLTEIIPLFETAGRSLFGPLCVGAAAPDEGNLHLLKMFANEEQHERYLKPLAAGSTFSAFAMTEPAPGVGSDPTMLRTTARRDGDSWIIDGHKWWTTNASLASFLIIMARTDDSLGKGGATLFLVPIDSPGIEIVRRIPHMGGPDFGGHGEVRFNGLRVGDDAILGEVGSGFALVQARLGPARLTHCMRWTGIAQRALEIAAHHANQREAFGSTLGGHQAVQWMLADSATELHAGRLMIQHCAWMIENGQNPRKETSMCKVHVAETVGRVLDRAIQICGGLGVSRDLPLSGWYEAARAFRIYDGASEVHRMVIARQILKGRF